MSVNYKGRISSVDYIPRGEHRPGAVRLNAADNTTKSKFIYAIILLALFLPVMIYIMVIGGPIWMVIQLIIGAVLVLPSLILLGKLQARCIGGNCDIYLLKAKGWSVILSSSKEMTRSRFILSMIIPIIIMVPLPYFIGLLLAPAIGFAAFSAATVFVSSFMTNFKNILAALKQIPNDAMVYMHGNDVFWYASSHETNYNEAMYKNFSNTQRNSFCPNCGNKNPENAIFCNVCGMKLSESIKNQSYVTNRTKTEQEKFKVIHEVVSFAPLTEKQIRSLNARLK